MNEGHQINVNVVVKPYGTLRAKQTGHLIFAEQKKTQGGKGNTGVFFGILMGTMACLVLAPMSHNDNYVNF